MNRLTDKIAIITGGAGGIGRQTAAYFLDEGAHVVLVDRDEDTLAQAENALRSRGQVTAIMANVTDESAVRGYVETTLDAYGRIDVFFNNAAIIGPIAPLVDQTVENMDALFAVNVRGVFLGLKHVLPTMIRQRSGSIINTSSTGGVTGVPGLGFYCASKHAVVGLTKTAAIESAKDNIRVNCIHPAATDTAMIRAVETGRNPGGEHEAKQEFIDKIPLKRYGHPQDIANLTVFLASDESTFISGSQYRIDGGMAAL